MGRTRGVVRGRLFGYKRSRKFFYKSYGKRSGAKRNKGKRYCGRSDRYKNERFLNPEEKEILTNEISLMRFGKTNEVADLAVYLASDRASFVTGQVISADGCMV